MNERDLCSISAEINSVSMLVSGLSNQLDNKESDSLACESLKLALHGISNYLDRIAEDINSIDCVLVEEGVTTHE